MATLKRPSKRRTDQPTLFGSTPEPLVVTHAKIAPTKSQSQSQSKPDNDEPPLPTDEPPTDEPRQHSGSVSRLSAALGRYTPCYVLREQRSVIDLASTDAANADPLVSTRCLLYIARNLFWAAASLPAWDLEPSLIWVRFSFEEQPSPPRECWLMTFELEELILSRLSAAEAAGSIDSGKMPDLYRRWAAIEREWNSGVISRAYDYCKIDSAKSYDGLRVLPSNIRAGLLRRTAEK